MEALGTAVEVGLIPETTLNVTPASPQLKRYRFISRNINGTKNILESQEVAPHAQVTENRHGFTSVAGTLSGELLTGGYDSLLESALGATWGDAVAVSGSASVTAPATVTMTTSGLQVGDFVRLAGFANEINNGVFQIVAITGGSATVAVSAAQPLVSQSGGTAAVTGRRLRMAAPLLKSFTIERAFPDINQFELFTGVAANGVTLSATPESIVNVSFPMLGIQPKGLAGTSISTNYATNYAANGFGYSAPATGSPYDAFSGAIIEGTAVVGYVTSIEMTVDGGLTTQAVIGSKFSSGLYPGRRMVSGTISALFQNATLANKFINEVETKIGVWFKDPNGVDYQSIYMPRVKINGHSIDPGQTGPVIAQAPFVAIYDNTLLTSLIWYRSNAA